MVSYVAWFSEINKDSTPLAGGKGCNLGIMYNAGMPVPGGFVITSYAFKHFIHVTGIDEKIFAILKKVDIENSDELNKASEDVQKLVMETQMPLEVKNQILEAYEMMDVDPAVRGTKIEELIKAGRNGGNVAVRSSATAEDLAEASFAGQQASFLNIKGVNRLLVAVMGCWASLYTARAIYYRVRNNFPHEKVLIAVVVQKMVNSDVAGVMFSVNPVNQNKNEILIESAYGLGEAVVSGSITPDEYIVNKKNLDIEKQNIVEKTWMYTRDSKTLETIKVDVAKHKQGDTSLLPNEVRILAELAIKIEKHYGKPQDLEFAVERGKVYIVQSRPITTLGKQVKTEVIAKNVEQKKEENIGDVDVKDATLLVSGLPASPGVGKGKVVQVHDLSDMKKVQKGDVLVTRMTTPDNVPAMEKASAIVTDAGGSTCFAGNTKILTHKGFKSMEEVYLSEDLFFTPSINRDSLKIEWKPILAKMKRRANAIQVSCSQNGKVVDNTLVLTEDHKMLTYVGRDLVEKNISSIINDEEMLLVAQRIPAINYRLNLDSKKAYLLGALMTDGYVRVNNRRGIVVFTQKNTDLKSKFINQIVSSVSEIYSKQCSVRYKETNNTIRGKIICGSANDYTWCSKSMAQDVVNVKEVICELFLSCEEEVIYNFLAGVIDGDGSYNSENNRFQIYCGKKNLLDAVVLGCLRLGIVPQVTRNRNIANVQIVEKVDKIMNYTNRVKGNYSRVCNSTRLFSAKQLIGNIVEKVNYKGRVKPYVQNNLLLGSDKIKNNLLPMCSDEEKLKLQRILKSDTRMTRVIFNQNIGEIDVYNITVLDNHNYVVFTNKMTPILVNNCHAAIVSRELGIPCIVGTEVATSKLKDGMFVTVDAHTGKVYEGNVRIHEDEAEPVLKIKTKIKVKVNVDMPQLAERAVNTGADGVGLLRSELINMENKIHPVYMIENGQAEQFISHLTEGLKIVAKAFKGKPVWYRTLDARTDEFRNLKGGEQEPKEDNPMMGWRSIRRSLDQPELLRAEFEAIKRVHKSGLTNIGVMLPLVTDNIQVREAKKIFRDCTGIEPVEEIEFGVMIETPAAVQMIDEICQEGISFISLGTNDLTQFTLACDRNSERVAKMYDEMHPAVLREIHKVVQTCKKYKVLTSICGQAGSNLEMVKFLQKEGVDSISANLDAVNAVRKTVAKAEGLLK